MKLYAVQTLCGPSVFCHQTCILASFGLAQLHMVCPCEYDELVSEKALLEFSSIGIKLGLIDDNSALPGAIKLIKAVVEAFMQRLDLSCGNTAVSQDGSEKVFLAFAQKERLLTTRIVQGVIRWVVDLYAQEQTASDSRNVDQLNELKQLLQAAKTLSKSRATQCMQDSLRAEHKPWFALDVNLQDNNVFQIGFGRQQQLMKGTVSFESSQQGIQVCHSKIKTLQFLSQLGFPVPQQSPVMHLQQACNVAQQMAYPVVLKAEFGTQGNHVFADLRDANELSDAWRALKATLGNKNIGLLIEKNLPGSVYRVEVVKGEFFDAYEMIPAGIIGDGVQSVKELVDSENKNPARKPKTDPSGTFVNLQLAAAELLTLEKQGLTIDSVPADGQTVRLSSTSNWSRGGTYKNVTEMIHEDNKRLVERLAAALKIDLIGIDLIADDIQQSFLEGNLHVLEVNHAPDMGNYYDLQAQRYVDVSQRIIERLAPDRHYGDVPVIAFKHCSLANEAQTLLAQLLNQEDYSAAVINQQGIVINGQVWANADQVNETNPSAQLLRNNSVGAAIIDYSPQCLADFGLGYGGCDIAVLLQSRQNKDEAIVSLLWSQGLPSNTLDGFLVNAARTASIIFVDNQQAAELCLQGQPDKTYALFTDDISEMHALISAGVNAVQFIRDSEQGSHIRLHQQGQSQDISLAVKKTGHPLALLTVFTSCLILGIAADAINKLDDYN